MKPRIGITVAAMLLLSTCGLLFPVSTSAVTIQGSDPTVTVSPTTVIQNDYVNYTGSGFTPSAQVNVAIQSGYSYLGSSIWWEVGNPLANGTGSISGTFQAGMNIQPGEREINFTDSVTDTTVTRDVLVNATVTFFINPTGIPSANSIVSNECGGSFMDRQSSTACGSAFSGAAPPDPSTGWLFDHWGWTGNSTNVVIPSGITCSAAGATVSCSVFSAGNLTAFYSAAIGVSTDPANMGSVSFGACSNPPHYNGTTFRMMNFSSDFPTIPATENICAAVPPNGYMFVGWTSSGGVTLTNPSFLNTAIQMVGPGTITAHYAPVQIRLYQGWNLVSLPIVPTSTTVTTLLKSLLDKKEVVSVWAYTGIPRTWRVYLPGKSSTLSSISDGNGYWIFMTSTDVLNLTGSVIVPAQVPPSYALVKGWNLVGFKAQPAITSETLAQYLSSISGKYDSNNVWVYANDKQTWVRAGPSSPIHPGQGMWILVTTPVTLRP